MGQAFRHFRHSKTKKTSGSISRLLPIKPFRLSLTYLREQRGSAIVMAAIFMLVGTILMTVGARLVSDARKLANDQTYGIAVAENAAEAGLMDTIGWFKRQTTQPVAANPASQYGALPNPTPIWTQIITTNNGSLAVSYSDEAFYPVYNSSNPVSTDTIDSTGNIGLVNEFSPDGAGSVSEATTDGSQPRWERYEVQRQLPGAAAVTGAVHDATGERVPGNFDGQGLVWDIQAVGYYYLRKDFTKSATAPYYWVKDYKTPPNKLLATAKMATEIRKVATNLPGGKSSGLFVPNVANVKLVSNTYLSDGHNGSSTYAWVSGSAGKPVTGGSLEVSGAGLTLASAVSLQAPYVFGLSVTDFANMDTVVKPAASGMTFSSIPNNSIIYYNGNLTIDPAGGSVATSLIGPSGIQTGILIVNGNFTLNSTASQQNIFNGIVYVTGSVNMTGSQIQGALILGGNNSTGVTLAPIGGQPAGIFNSPKEITNLQTNLPGYLEDISARRKFLAIPNI